ncbi:MAG: ABC transporter permease [Treponema sp.]|nr:ABC transporter permease [Treponema sp.]
MSSGRISTVKIALNNILHRRFRSACIALLIALTTLFITGGTLFSAGLRNGINSVSARLGADLMVFPHHAGPGLEALLLAGASSTIYLSADVARRVMELDGIERATKQIFISTYDSEHCIELAQVIGYDPQTDFVIRPWLLGSQLTEPEYMETVVGANVTASVGMIVPLFDIYVKIVGQLDRTGMGFDNTFFVNMETARTLFEAYLSFPYSQPLPEGMDIDSVVSVVLIDIRSDKDPVEFQRSLHFGFRGEGVSYMMSQVWVLNTARNLDLVAGVLGVLLAAMWIFAVFALVVIFVLMFNERRREFGILRAIGATRKKLAGILLTESALLSGGGAFLGAVLAGLVVFSYNPLIGHILQTVYLPPRILSALLIVLLGFVSGSAAGPAASFLSVRITGKSEVFANMREAA